MSKPLVIEPETERDLLEAHEWYENQLEGLGLDFLLCFEAALETISQRPSSFPIVAKKPRRALLRRFAYANLFVELPETIAVIGVFHGSRSPSLWRRRVR